MKKEDLLEHAARIVQAQASLQVMTPKEVVEMLDQTYQTMARLIGADAPAPAPARPQAVMPPRQQELPVETPAPAAQSKAQAKPEPDPAVPVDQSIHDDYIVCLECGHHLKMAKRHLRTAHGLTPEEYRRRYDLPHDYPMIAPKYAEEKSKYAKHIGLGRKR